MTPRSSATERVGAPAALVGRSFAAALARRDFGEVRALLDPEVDFCALTPSRTWDPRTPEEVVDVVRRWFGSVVVDQVLAIDVDLVGDRPRLRHRFLGRRDGVPFVIEQLAYFEVRDHRLTWVRLVCSGFRPAPESASVIRAGS